MSSLVHAFTNHVGTPGVLTDVYEASHSAVIRTDTGAVVAAAGTYTRTALGTYSFEYTTAGIYGLTYQFTRTLVQVEDGPALTTTITQEDASESGGLTAAAYLAQIKGEIRVTTIADDARITRLITEAFTQLQAFKAKTLVDVVTDEDTEAVPTDIDLRFVAVYVALWYTMDMSLDNALSTVLMLARDKEGPSDE